MALLITIGIYFVPYTNFIFAMMNKPVGKHCVKAIEFVFLILLCIGKKW